MTEIPDDIMEAARECCANFFTDHRELYVEDVARAILAERERCARIIDENMLCHGANGGEVLHPRSNPGNKVGMAYAAAIRRGDEAQIAGDVKAAVEHLRSALAPAPLPSSQEKEADE